MLNQVQQQIITRFPILAKQSSDHTAKLDKETPGDLDHESALGAGGNKQQECSVVV